MDLPYLASYLASYLATFVMTPSAGGGHYQVTFWEAEVMDQEGLIRSGAFVFSTNPPLMEPEVSIHPRC